MRTDGGLPGWRVAPLSSEPPQSEWAPILLPPRLAACRDKHRRGQSDGRSGGETHGSESREMHGRTAGMKVELEKQAAGVREGGNEENSG